MNIIVVSPDQRGDAPQFVEGLASAGVRVLGVGERSESYLADTAREAMAGYLRVGDLTDERDVLDRVRRWTKGIQVDRVETMTESRLALTARLRETVGAVGMSSRDADLFTDRKRVEELLEWHGIRTGREQALDGERYSCDILCVDGKTLLFNVCWYPRPLSGSEYSPVVSLREFNAERLAPGRTLSRVVLKTLGFRTGIAHVKWVLGDDGEATFVLFMACPPGGGIVDLIDYACEVDLYAGWGEAISRGRFSQVPKRRYNAAVVHKRIVGDGWVHRIDGLNRLRASHGQCIAHVALPEVGSRVILPRDPATPDGYVIVRHSDLARALDIAELANDLVHVHAGPDFQPAAALMRTRTPPPAPVKEPDRSV